MADSTSHTVHEYAAFISYRHIPRDAAIAARLHAALEAYRTPRHLVKKGVPARLGKVFRDREELPTSSNLGEDIENALAKSSFLILVCSPEALESRWVLKEVETFSRIHGVERILPLLAAGEPETAFPAGLIRYQTDGRGEVCDVIEPLAADVRPRDGKGALRLIGTEKLRLLAAMLGCGYDELRQREQERRLRRILAVSISAAAFLLAFGLFTLRQLNEVSAAREVALINEKRALEAKAQAQENEREALETQSMLYASLARRAADDGDRLLGMSLAMEALPADPANPGKPLVRDAQHALTYASAIRGTQGITRYRTGGDDRTEDAKRCFIPGEGDVLVTVGRSTLRYYDAGTGNLLREWAAGEGFEILAVDGKAGRAVVAAAVPGSRADVRLVDVERDATINSWAFSLGNNAEAIEYSLASEGMGRFLRASFNGDGTVVSIVCNRNDAATDSPWSTGESTGEAALYRADTGETYRTVERSSPEIKDAYFLRDGTFVYHAGYGRIVAYAPDSGTVRLEVSGDLSPVNLSTDGKSLLYAGLNAYLRRMPLGGGEEEDLGIHAPQISPDGSTAAYFGKEPITGADCFAVKELAGNRVLVRLTVSDRLTRKSLFHGFQFSGDSRYILFDDLKVVDIANNEVTLPEKPAYLAEIVHCALDFDGTRLLLTDSNGISATVLLNDPTVKKARLPLLPDGAAVAGSGIVCYDNRDDGTYSLWQWDDAEGKATQVEGASGAVMALQPLDGSRFACGIRKEMEYYGYFKEVHLYQPGGIQKVIAPFSTDFQADLSSGFVLTNGDGGCKLWDAETGSLVRHMNPALTVGTPLAGMHTAGFFPSGDTCWSITTKIDFGYEGVTIQKVRTGEIVGRIPLKDLKTLTSMSAVISGDGTRILTVSLEGAQIWGFDGEMRPYPVGKAEGDFLCSGTTAVALRHNNTVRIVDWATGKTVSVLTTGNTEDGLLGRFAPDGTTLLTMNTGEDASVTERRLTQWDCASGKELATLYADSSLDGRILDFGFIDGGTGIAIAAVSNGSLRYASFPYLATFDEVYRHAKEKLGGRAFDIEADLDTMQ